MHNKLCPEYGNTLIIEKQEETFSTLLESITTGPAIQATPEQIEEGREYNRPKIGGCAVLRSE